MKFYAKDDVDYDTIISANFETIKKENNVNFALFSYLNQDSSNGGGHECGERSAKHGLESDFGEVAFSVGSDATDTTELNADGTKVCKAA